LQLLTDVASDRCSNGRPQWVATSNPLKYHTGTELHSHRQTEQRLFHEIKLKRFISVTSCYKKTHSNQEKIHTKKLLKNLNLRQIHVKLKILLYCEAFSCWVILAIMWTLASLQLSLHFVLWRAHNVIIIIIIILFFLKTYKNTHTHNINKQVLVQL